MRGTLAIAGISLIGFGTYQLSAAACSITIGAIMLALATGGAIITSRKNHHARPDDHKPRH